MDYGNTKYSYGKRNVPDMVPDILPFFLKIWEASDLKIGLLVS